MGGTTDICEGLVSSSNRVYGRVKVDRRRWLVDDASGEAWASEKGVAEMDNRQCDH